MLQGCPEESSDIIPIFLDRVFCIFEIIVPVTFQLIHENTELLVIGVLFDGCPSL